MSKQGMKAVMGLVLALILPSAAMAERPEVDCNTLPDASVQEFYEILAQIEQAASEKKMDDVFSLSQRAMKICNTDVYVEFMLGRSYQLNNDCPNAYYHYEQLDARPASVKKDNGDVYKGLAKYFKEVKSKCGDVVPFEVTCETPDVMLQIQGVTDSAVSCPYYSKARPGAYTAMATKNGFQSWRDTLTVSNSGGSFKVPALREVGASGYIRVRCPKGASKFVLTSSNGTVDEYTCPWEGEVAADTYRIYLGGGDEKDATVVTVGARERVEHVIASTKSSCHATPLTHTYTSYAVIAGFLVGLGAGLALRRRRPLDGEKGCEK